NSSASCSMSPPSWRFSCDFYAYMSSSRSVSAPPSSPPRSSSASSSISSSLPPLITSSGSLWRPDISSPIGDAAGDGRDGTRRAGADGLRLALRFAVRALLAAPRFAAPLREAAVLRALLRDAPAARPVFRAALLLRPADALRLRLAFDFFLPRG